MKCPDCDQSLEVYYEGETAEEVMKNMHPHYMEAHKDIMASATPEKQQALVGDRPAGRLAAIGVSALFGDDGRRMKTIARMRNCLKCQTGFFSLSPANRICRKCQRENNKLYRHYPESVLAKERGRKYYNGEVMSEAS